MLTLLLHFVTIMMQFKYVGIALERQEKSGSEGLNCFAGKTN